MLGPDKESKILSIKKLSKSQQSRVDSGKRDKVILYLVTSIIVEPMKDYNKTAMTMYDTFESEEGNKYCAMGDNIFYVQLLNNLVGYQYKPKHDFEFHYRHFGKGREEDCLNHAINYYVERLKKYAKDNHISFEKEEYRQIREFLKVSVMGFVNVGRD